MYWSNEIDRILCVGRDLAGIGISNWALGFEDAMVVLDRMHSMKIPVVGGDVYRLEDSRIRPTYDSWFCEQENDESDDSYLERSIESAKSYLRKFNITGSTALFALVPRIKGSKGIKGIKGSDSLIKNEDRK